MWSGHMKSFHTDLVSVFYIPVVVEFEKWKHFRVVPRFLGSQV